ncbi:MAG: HAD-IIB family hydrolase [Candidatus Doudnabacteria bacterium]|nr:HAD-IIB family hydrolase [Candidatus Doudnabacteria bacterium]
MAKKVIAFDLDGTLAPSKSTLPDRMAEALGGLLGYFHVCVISGGKFDQFKLQLIDNLHVSPDKLEKLHIMPTCGTRYYTYDVAKDDWEQVYAEDFGEDDKQRITAAIEEAIDYFGYRPKKLYGEMIEDRGSQVTYSALGQDVVAELGDEGVELKEAWDPDSTKKLKLQKYLAERLPDFEVRAGGATSIDVTKPGIDKAYGMEKLMEMLQISKDDILFLGDKLQEGGNDYPVKAMGIDSLEVSRWEDTSLVLEGILHITK